MISSLTLENFKCFSKVQLPIRPMTLLSGLNGSGKSTVIQSLLLLRQSYEHNMLPHTGLSLNGDLLSLGEGRDALYEAAELEEIEIAIGTAPGGDHHWRFKYDSTADLLALDTMPVIASDLHCGLLTDEFQYLCAERIGPRTSYPVSDFAVRQHRQLGKSGEFAAQYLNDYGRRERVTNSLLLHKDATDLLRDQAEAWMGEISPGTRIHYRKLAQADLVNMTFSFVVGKQVGNEYRPTNVGFGISYSLAVILALLTTKSGGLLLVENPEAHLHPRGQMWLGQLLTRAAAGGVQVIVETHSDHVLNGLRLTVYRSEIAAQDVGIFHFSRSEQEGRMFSEVTAPTIDSDGRIDPWPSGFFDQNDIALMELLTPKMG